MTTAASTSEQAIAGGTDDDADTNVVDIAWSTSSGQQAECSGSLIAPNLVLTAHHCVSLLNNAPAGDEISCQLTNFAAPDPVSNFKVSTTSTLGALAGSFHAVADIEVPPGSTATGFCGDDLALLVLADDVDPSEALPLVPKVDEAIADGDVYSAIGFGLTGGTGFDAGQRRRRDGLKVACVLGPCQARVQVDFHTEWVGDIGACQGDSGGPALDDKRRVIGAFSRLGPNCTTPVYTSIHPWAGFIKDVAKTAATAGSYPVPSWATGYPTDPAFTGDVGGKCSDTCPVCVDDICSRKCNEAAPCPTGFACTSGECRVPPKPAGCASTSSAGFVIVFAVLLQRRRIHRSRNGGPSL